MLGTIKTLKDDKGFGFIKPEDGGKDVFFHCSKVQGASFKDLRVGDAVNFDIEESPKGPSAYEVTLA